MVLVSCAAIAALAIERLGSLFCEVASGQNVLPNGSVEPREACAGSHRLGVHIHAIALPSRTSSEAVPAPCDYVCHLEWNG